LLFNFLHEIKNMFTCPVCGDWILTAKLCGECDTIRQLCKLYGKDKLLEVLNKTMIIQKLKEDKKDTE